MADCANDNETGGTHESNYTSNNRNNGNICNNNNNDDVDGIDMTRKKITENTFAAAAAAELSSMTLSDFSTSSSHGNDANYRGIYNKSAFLNKHNFGSDCFRQEKPRGKEAKVRTNNELFDQKGGGHHHQTTADDDADDGDDVAWITRASSISSDGSLDKSLSHGVSSLMQSDGYNGKSDDNNIDFADRPPLGTAQQCKIRSSSSDSSDIELDDSSFDANKAEFFSWHEDVTRQSWRGSIGSVFNGLEHDSGGGGGGGNTDEHKPNAKGITSIIPLDQTIDHDINIMDDEISRLVLQNNYHNNKQTQGDRHHHHQQQQQQQQGNNRHSTTIKRSGNRSPSATPFIRRGTSSKRDSLTSISENRPTNLIIHHQDPNADENLLSSFLVENEEKYNSSRDSVRSLISNTASSFDFGGDAEIDKTL